MKKKQLLNGVLVPGLHGFRGACGDTLWFGRDGQGGTTDLREAQLVARIDLDHLLTRISLLLRSSLERSSVMLLPL